MTTARPFNPNPFSISPNDKDYDDDDFFDDDDELDDEYIEHVSLLDSNGDATVTNGHTNDNDTAKFDDPSPLRKKNGKLVTIIIIALIAIIAIATISMKTIIFSSRNSNGGHNDIIVNDVPPATSLPEIANTTPAIVATTSPPTVLPTTIANTTTKNKTNADSTKGEGGEGEELKKSPNSDGGKNNSIIEGNHSEAAVPTTTIATTKNKTNTENKEEEELKNNPSSSDSGNNNPITKGNNSADHDDKTVAVDDETELFQLNTGNDRIDKAYKLAMDELNENVKSSNKLSRSVEKKDDNNNDDDGDNEEYFIAGAGWDQLWTRDTSYAIELAAGLIKPSVAMRSLQKCTSTVNNSEVWYQDKCGHFDGWPNLSDAIVGARGAWNLYLYTGNSTFLEWAYEITIASLRRAEQDVLHCVNGNCNNDKNNTMPFLFKGCSSFMESNSGYPQKYHSNGTLVGQTKAFSTNVLYYNGYYYAYKMGEILMENTVVVDEMRQRAQTLKKTIRDKFWRGDKYGLYGYFKEENGKLIDQTDGLGISLAMLSENFETNHRSQLMLTNAYRTQIGIPSLWPRFEYDVEYPASEFGDKHISDRYHNGRIWPFVSAYFAIAAAKHDRIDIFAEELLRLVDLSEQNNTFAEYYELDKTFPPKRRRQLWSDTGYLGMIYKGLFGMEFRPDGIVFKPNKYNGNKDTKSDTTIKFLKLNETISLTGIKYRKMVVDLHVGGYGNNVRSFKVNGKVKESPKLDGYAEGKQLIEIVVGPKTSD